ncbi:MAG: cysteine--tRNA ligase [Candidatus Dormibacteraeota bacterium]|uniref:Cysteine--tRNA ligase n=1 Tax=Candidatus Amunia macphersoniae TaxID=3127014 RepID=A0A934KML4_9BACT|nr:cysteine--tRNA ligase [Candidatus Dormibacteraeota bacterium]
MQLFDTAAGAVTPLIPRGGRVSMYVCGITPYDGGHIGHAFTYHTFDLITRRLRAEGVKVRSVRNVTDVDDDILRVARLRGVDYHTLGAGEAQRFDADMSDLGLLRVEASPRATARVPEMVEWIARLIDCRVAYAADGRVYFDVRNFPRYGALSGLSRATMIELSRTRGADPDDPRKRDPLDFVLWQPSDTDEPSWPSPWSPGRPGWHIECTVLAATELALPMDIHGGGDDLIYPHHESEIAQTVGAGVPSYARHWVHVAMVGYRGEKMSKSLGNTVFVRDLLNRVPAGAVRLMLCAHHHRAAWEYDDGELTRAQSRWSDYLTALTAGARFTNTDAQAVYDDFMARLDDDLDTPGALAILDEVAGRPLVPGDELAARVTAGQVLAPMLDILGVRMPLR